MTFRRKYLSNLASNILLLGAGSVVNFVLLRVYASALGVSGAGVWVFLATVADFFTLMDLGFSSATMKHASEAFAASDTCKERDVFSYSRRIFERSGFWVLVLGGITAAGLQWMVPWSGRILVQARLALFVLGVEVAVNLVVSPWRTFLQSRHRFDAVNWILLLRMLGRFVLIVVGLRVIPSLLIIAVAGLVTTGMASLAIVVTARGAKGSEVLARSPEGTTRGEVVSRVRKYATWAFAGVIAVRLAYSADSLVIGKFLDPAYITLYFSAWKLVEFVRMIGHGATPFFLPFGSERAARKDWTAVSTALYQGIRIVVLLTFPVWVLLLGCGRDLLVLWMGPAFQDAYPILVLLALPQILILCFSAGSSLLYGLGLHRFLVMVSLFSGAVNVTLSIVWVRSLGIVGVALATMTVLLLSFLFNITMYPRWLRASRSIVLRIIGRGVVLLGGLTALAAGGNTVLQTTVSRMVLCMGLAAAFIPLFLIWEFSKDEILALKNMAFEAMERRGRS